jgi:exopolysaccharide biosynthesis WecB/TagA/CpsF family protein
MSNLNQINLFALNLVNATADHAVDALLRPGLRQTAAFINAHCVNVAARDKTYHWALSRADYLLPDGSGVQLAAKMKGHRFIENLNGTDLFVPICQKAAASGLSVFFFGSSEGVARRAADKAREIAPGLVIAGVRNGFFSNEDEDRIIDEINTSRAGILLVALGVPKQEIWIARNRHRLNADIVMGVGAQFDFWSGRVRRAPLLMRKAGLEWLMRLAVEPRRMARRYLVGNFTFVVRSLMRRRLTLDARPVRVSGKRFLDLTIASGGLIVLAPLMALIGFAIKCNSPGPVFFRQIRIGERGKPFVAFKFRSMYRDAELRRSALLEKSDRAGICFKAKNDPRVTRVGRFLRRFSLDELPQLFNVWRGEMAIVGPRPGLPQEVAAYPEAARRRLEAKPGITGLWQIGGRAEIGFGKMVEMDTAYVQGRSLVLDLAIIGLTFRAVLSGRGAY